MGYDGGYIIPRESSIGKSMREHFKMLTKTKGIGELTPVYLEKGVFVLDYYLKPATGADLKGLGDDDENVLDEKQANASGGSESSGNSRPAPKP